MKKSHALAALAILSALTTSCGKNTDAEEAEAAAARKSRATPGVLSGEKNFATLINNYAQGKSDHVPWAGYWWPFSGNGIASGMAGTGGSPAGKYDASRGGKTKAQEWEVRNHGSGIPKLQQWWGHCNGWCAAAAIFDEPREAKRVNGITFEVADIKALLSEAGMAASYDFYGNRPELERNGRDHQLAYDDVVPDQYFLLLTNYVGKAKIPLLFDRYTGDQVWNQPLAGYKIHYPKPADYIGAAPGAPNLYRINILSTVWWAEDAVPPGVLTETFDYAPTPPGEDGADMREGSFSVRTLKSEIRLDGPVVFGADGKITSSGNVVVTRHPENPKFVIGGAWKGGSMDSHPDYMWIPFSINRPEETNADGTPQTDSNTQVDIEWIRNYLLKGIDEPNVTPAPVPSVPVPHPSASPVPIPTFTSNPIPVPTITATPRPTHTPRP